MSRFPQLHNLVFETLFLGLATLPASNLPPVQTNSLPTLTLGRGADPCSLSLMDHFQDPDVPGSAARMYVIFGTGEPKILNIALYDEATPITVANFLQYTNEGRYNDNFIHRSVPGFVFQGGGYLFVEYNVFDWVETHPPILNEPGISNTRGTLAMAKIGGDPDSATSQWFINLSDNSANLDYQNGGFTVFGRILESDWDVLDEIGLVTPYDTREFELPWDSIPLTADYLNYDYFLHTSIQQILPLTFTVESSDPSLVTATVENGLLEITPASGQTGEAVLALTVTDLEGASIETTLNIQIRETYESWASLHPFPDTEAAAPDADPNGNGQPNILAFAFGADPLSPGSPDAGKRILGSGHLQISLRRTVGLQFSVLESSDLQTWNLLWQIDDGTEHSAILDHENLGDFDILTFQSTPATPNQPVFWKVSASLEE